MEEEIDLREYIAVIIKRWYWIVALTLIAALIALGVSAMLPSVYEAEAKIIILRASTSISFEPRIQSDISPDQQNLKNNQETLVNLARSSSVAEQVLEQLPELISTDELTVLNLLKKIDTSNTANLISIKVNSKAPETAALIANRWAEVYVTFINQLYSDRSGTLLAEVEQQVAEADRVYKQAQSRVEAVLGDNQIAVLQRDIALLKQDLNTKYGTVEKEISRQNELLAQKHNELNELEALLDDTRTLQDQLTVGSTSKGAMLGDALALVLLRKNAIDDNLRVHLNFDLNEVDNTLSTAEDVAAVIEVIEVHKVRVLDDITTLTADLLATRDELIVSETSSDNEFVAAVEPALAKVATLESQLETEQARTRELIAARDSAWENLQAVQRKLAEVTLETQLTDSEVKIAAPAIVPEDRISPRPLLNILIGAALGFMVALVLIFIIEYWADIVQLADAKSASSDTSTPSSETA